MSVVKTWKIRRQCDGLFSSGGAWPRFSNRGKVWKRLAYAQSHLKQLSGGFPKHETRDWEIVEYEQSEPVEVSVSDCQTVLDEIQRKEKEKEEATLKYREERDKRERKGQYEQLKKEFG
jgi:hypothetical protein